MDKQLCRVPAWISLEHTGTNSSWRRQSQGADEERPESTPWCLALPRFGRASLPYRYMRYEEGEQNDQSFVQKQMKLQQRLAIQLRRTKN